jgi:putative peptide zinc metalloprotease protein
MSSVELPELRQSMSQLPASHPPPVLREGVKVLPFDSSLTEERFLLVRRDGRRWHISAYLAAVIHAIDGQRCVEQIATAVAANLGRTVLSSDIERVLGSFLATNDIIEPTAWAHADQTPPLAARRSSTTFRLPLIWGRPLRLVTGCMTWLFRGPFAWPTVLLMVGFQVIWCLIHLRWISFATHMSWASELVPVLTLLFVSLLLHEFGHASACRAFGAKEGEIGFAIYLVFPVFYCDVTDAWKLTRRERAALDLAGLYTQGLFATLMLVLFIVTERDLFLFTFLAISASYIPNLNPFLKMDGYWFLSDMLGVANLSQRVGELLRGNRSTMQSMSRTMASLTYLYLVTSIAYMAAFFFWLGRYAVVLLRGAYLEKLRVLLMDSFSEPAELIPDLLGFLIATMLLIFLPFLLWRTLRGCIAWMKDIANILRTQRTAQP